MRMSGLKRIFWPATSPSMNLLGWSARYGHPVHDVESLIQRFGARPQAANVKAVEQKIRDIIDGRF